MREPWRYYGANVYPAGVNSSGIRWWAMVNCSILRADTKDGMRHLIRETLPATRR